MKAAHVPEPCGTRSCLAPPSLRRKTMALCRRGGGANPPHAHDAIFHYGTYKIYITQNRGFVLQGGRGQPLPSCDTKPRFCVENKALGKKIGFQHLRHAKSSRLGGSASFDETKHLGGVWTQDRGLGNQILKSQKYGPGTAKVPFGERVLTRKGLLMLF